jgi:hypothetical protein
MATRLTARPLSRENIHIDESDKVHILPVIRPSAGEVFGLDSEREERDTATQDRTQAVAQVGAFLWFAAGAATVLVMVIPFMAWWLKR